VEYLTFKAKEYLDRAEKVKRLISTRKSAGIYRELTRIESGSTGHGYASVFGRFLDGTVKYIDIEDPYIRAFHQVYCCLHSSANIPTDGNITSISTQQCNCYVSHVILLSEKL